MRHSAGDDAFHRPPPDFSNKPMSEEKSGNKIDRCKTQNGDKRGVRSLLPQLPGVWSDSMAVSHLSGPFESEEAERSPLPPDFPHKNLIEKNPAATAIVRSNGLRSAPRHSYPFKPSSATPHITLVVRQCILYPRRSPI